MNLVRFQGSLHQERAAVVSVYLILPGLRANLGIHHPPGIINERIREERGSFLRVKIFTECERYLIHALSHILLNYSVVLRHLE